MIAATAEINQPANPRDYVGIVGARPKPPIRHPSCGVAYFSSAERAFVCHSCGAVFSGGEWKTGERTV